MNKSLFSIMAVVLLLPLMLLDKKSDLDNTDPIEKASKNKKHAIRTATLPLQLPDNQVVPLRGLEDDVLQANLTIQLNKNPKFSELNCSKAIIRRLSRYERYF